ncbi:hypothetical protein [Embleya scabrispora]|uniref:hypothetical protein n=1 Tax=Embleya scabrispora TaxID=159449 RepID=UPI00035C5E4B|nr:hypothetical protein [Embleya scabrispora]MYS84662.1 hypothetical protein [Streptomyces sp. SID5474]
MSPGRGLPGDPAGGQSGDTAQESSDDAAERLLRLAAVHRTVPDVARMIAILRDRSAPAAEDALREVAVARPVSDLVLLAELLSDPTHADQGRRPVAEPAPRVQAGPRAAAAPKPAPAPAPAPVPTPAPSAFTIEARPARAPSPAAQAGPGAESGAEAGTEAGTGLRWATAVGLAVSGLALGSAVPSSVRTPPYAAVWLASVGLVCLFLAGVTAVRAGRGARLAALAAGCVTIATAVLPRLVAGQNDGAWLDVWGLLALGAGALTAVCAAAFLARSDDQPTSSGRRHPNAFEPWEATMKEHRPTSTTRMLG